MFDPTDPYTKEIIDQRIAQFEAEAAEDYADAMELVNELEAAEAEQARAAAVDARIRELEDKIATEDDLLQQDADAATARDLGILDMAATADPFEGRSARFVPDGGSDEYGCPTGTWQAYDHE